MTDFREIVDMAFALITDDTFNGSLESYEEYIADGITKVKLAVPLFRYPRFDINNVVMTEESCFFTHPLTQEEKVILAQLVVIKWLETQIQTTELTRQEVYASSDFKKTSQASHLSRLASVKKELVKENATLQKWYGRRAIGQQGAISFMSGLGGGANV